MVITSFRDPIVRRSNVVRGDDHRNTLFRSRNTCTAPRLSVQPRIRSPRGRTDIASGNQNPQCNAQPMEKNTLCCSTLAWEDRPLPRMALNPSLLVEEKRQGTCLMRIQGTSIILCDVAQPWKIALSFTLFDVRTGCAWGYADRKIDPSCQIRIRVI